MAAVLGRPSLIRLFSLHPSATVVGSPAAALSSGQALDIMDRTGQRVMPSGAGYEWTAMSYQEKGPAHQFRSSKIGAWHRVSQYGHTEEIHPGECSDEWTYAPPGADTQTHPTSQTRIAHRYILRHVRRLGEQHR
jgi:hypothetical protein